jgi:hypothetical protein
MMGGEDDHGGRAEEDRLDRPCRFPVVGNKTLIPGLEGQSDRECKHWTGELTLLARREQEGGMLIFIVVVYNLVRHGLTRRL